MKHIFQKLAALRHIPICGSMTGLGTGFFWSLIARLFSLDQLFNSNELLISLTVPLIIGLAVWKILKIRLWIVLPIAGLTLLVPLIGIGIGGGNLLQMAFGGMIGGACWSIPFILYYFTRGLFLRQPLESLQRSGKTRSPGNNSD